MSDGLDIGTLSGRIEFEDKVTQSLDLIGGKVTQLEAKFSDMGGRVAESAAGFAIAETAIEGVKKAVEMAIDVFKEMTIEGAGIADIEDNFDHLTDSAGRLGATLVGALREGTHSTIDDLELIKLANKDLSAGMQLTDDQFRQLAQGAFALAQATGIDVKEALDTMNDAMLTGRTRALQMLTGKIDLSAAEDAYAKKLGTTADKLTEEGKLQSARAAILDSVGAATKRLGEQSDGLDEKVAQLQAQWKNWYDELAKQVATSPEVIGAFDAIKDAVMRAFGGDSQHALETVVDWVNYLADAVGTYGPVVIDWLASLRDWIINAYNTVKDTWNALPDWLQNVIVHTTEAGAAVYVLDGAMNTVTGTIFKTIEAAGGISLTLGGIPRLATAAGESIALMTGAIKALDFTSFAGAGLSLKLLGESALTAIGPLGQVALAGAAIFAAYEVGKTQPVSDFFMNLGLMVQGYSAEERAAMIETDHLTQAQLQQAAQAKAQEDAQAKVKAITDQVAEAMKGATTGVQQNSDALDRNKLVLSQTKEEAKAYADALAEMQTAGEGFRGTLETLDGEVVEAIKYYLDAGVAAEKLALAYGLTATQVHAVSEAFKEEQENLKLEQKQLNDSITRWTEYYQAQAEMSGSTTDKTIADIEKWKAEQIKSHQEAKTDTADFYDWVAAREAQMYEKSEQDRLEADTHSKAYWQKQKEAAREYYEFVLAHSDQFTSEWIAAAKTQYEAALKVADGVGQIGAATEKAADMVKTLSGELISLSEYQNRQAQGGSYEMRPLSSEETKNMLKGYKTFEQAYDGVQNAIKLATQDFYQQWDMGITNQDNITAAQLRLDEFRMLMNFLRQNPNYFGGRATGGPVSGDTPYIVGENGPEMFIPSTAGTVKTNADLFAAFGGVNRGDGGGTVVYNTIHVNGTAADVARKVSDEIMRTLKQHRQFGAA